MFFFLILQEEAGVPEIVEVLENGNENDESNL